MACGFTKVSPSGWVANLGCAVHSGVRPPGGSRVGCLFPRVHHGANIRPCQVAFVTVPGVGSAQQDRSGYLGEEVAALVVDHYERWEVLDLDAPDGLHSEFRVVEYLDVADGVLCQAGRRASD